MLQLLLADAPPTGPVTETSFGGLPVRPRGQHVAWPVCRTCHAAMQYLGRVKTDLGLELIFMCDNQPGLCDQWEADGGGNAVLVLPLAPELEFFEPPTTNAPTLRPTEYGARVEPAPGDDYDEAREAWAGPRRQVLGQLGGTPAWLQADETPTCTCCQQPMRFVAQLEEGPNYETAMNFGGGAAYLFDCPVGKTAAFLWQC